MKNFFLLLAVGVALSATAGGRRKPKLVSVDPERAQFVRASIGPAEDGGLNLMVCFKTNAHVEHECISTSGTALFPLLRGAPLEKWKDENGF